MPARSLISSFVLSLAFIGGQIGAAELYVSASGSDSAAGSEASPWKTVQHGCDQLKPGDTLIVLPGVYEEKIDVKTSGTPGNGSITIRGKEGAVISGKSVKGAHLIHLKNQSYIRIIGLELRDNTGVRDGSGIRIEGHGTGIELRNNRIHEIRGKDAMGITVYGTDRNQAVDQLVIDGNEIFNCDPAKSEALVLNGNVSNFAITNNIVHDVNNIGIDMIGGEVSTVGDATKVARNGVCRGNKVYRCRSNYEDGYAAGIYVDGGHDIIVEDNIVTQCDLGIEIGAENKGTVASQITVRGNMVFYNDKAGIVFGGYDKSTGRVQSCKFTGNTCYHNNRHKEDHNGELWVQWASDNEVTGNTFVVGGSESPLAQISPGGALGNTINGNHYYTDAGAEDAFFIFKNNDVNGFASWRATSRADTTSVFGPVEVKLPSVE
jgi:parallel beta-helix repeat protein